MSKSQEKLWMQQYRLGARLLARSLEPYPVQPLYTILDRTAADYPGSTALEYCGAQMNYADLKMYCDHLAAALIKLGIRPGDRCATALESCPQYIISAFALLKAGAIHVPCGTLQQAPELEHLLNRSGAETLIIMSSYLQIVKAVIPHTGIKRVIVASAGDFQPGIYPGTINRTYSFKKLIHQQSQRLAPPELKPMRDLAYLAFTGGATGRPKGVMLTHYNRLCNIRQGLPWMLSHLEKRIRGRGAIIIAVPLFHAYGDWIMLTAIYWGLKIILAPDPRNTDDLADLLQKKRPILTCVVPTQLIKLRDKDIPGITGRIISGASRLPAEVARDFSGKTDMPVSEGYGLTEAGPLTHMNLSGNRKHGIGVPVPDTDVVLINEKTGKKCTANEAGHMYIKGPQVMKGYWPNPGSGLVNGWLPTGDIARMDRDGYFYLVERLKEMINVSGYKVYPAMIDEILYRHPAVALAATIGVPDCERAGSERVKVVIQLKDHYKGIVTAEEIIDFCRKLCPPYAVPKLVEFRDEIPLTATQKPFKRKLREEETAFSP